MGGSVLTGAETATLDETIDAGSAGYGSIRYAACSIAEIENKAVARLLFYAAVIYFAIGVRIVKPNEWLVVLRFGKYTGFRKKGLHWVIPFVDKTVRVDLEQVSPSWKDTPDQILETEVHKWVSTRPPG